MKQFNILEAGLRLGVTFEPAFAFGLEGKATLVDFEQAFAVAFNPADVSANLFMMELKNLNFDHLARGLTNHPLPSPFTEFSQQFTIFTGALQVAPPNGVTMFEKKYEGGLQADLNMQFFSFVLDSHLKLNTDFIEIKGHLGPFETPNFKFESYESSDNGPYLELTLNQDRFDLEISGFLEIYNI